MTVKTYASVGYYDQNFIGAQGWSVATMKAYIDRILALGFTGIDFDVSVNFTNKGEITDQNYKVLIELLEYLKDKDVDTSIHLSWIRGTDNSAYIGSYGNEISTFGNDIFFKSLNSYFERFGKTFQTAGVDALFLGGLGGLSASSDLYTYWKDVISTARQDFKGKLTYQAYLPMKTLPEGDANKVAIWDLLDAIGLSVKPYISDLPVLDIDEILSGYFFSKLNYSSVQRQLEKLFVTYDKPLYLQFNAFALDNALDSGWDPTSVQLKAGKAVANYELQAKAFQVFFDFVKNHIGLDFDSTRSINIFLANFSLGPDESDWQYFSMANFPEPATTLIKNTLLSTHSELNLRSIVASPADDVIYSGQYAQSVHLGGGYDIVFGSKFNNTFFVDPLVTFAEISGKVSGWFDNGVTRFSLYVASNNKILGALDIDYSSLQSDSNSNWSSEHSFKVNLPIDDVPKDLKLTLTSNNGSSFVKLSDLNIFWLGEVPITFDQSTNTGNFNLQLSTQHPDWIFAGGGKYFDLNSLNLSNRRFGTSKIDGDDGIDSVFFPTAKTNYTLTKVFNSLFIKEKNAYTPDVLATNIERLVFTDLFLAIDLSGNAGTVAKILGAVFGKESVANQKYVGIGLHYADGGMSYEALAELAVRAKLGATAKPYDIANLVLTNVMGKANSAGVEYYASLLDSGQKSIGDIVKLGAEHPLNATNIDLVGLATTGIEYIPVS